MIKDKFSALWVSHSSISDYLKCPRSYFLKNMYRDPKNNHKIMVMQPPLALGQVVHGVIESVSNMPAENRLIEPLLEIFERAWIEVKGEKGGFKDQIDEKAFKQRGIEMIERLSKNPGPLLRKAIKIRERLPHYWLSEENNIIVCGRVDWLEFLEKEQAVHIIDFKTGKFDEDPQSLQLRIYCLLTKYSQKWPIAKVSYWYLDRDNEPVSLPLPDEQESTDLVLEIAKKIQLARKLERFTCSRTSGCPLCLPYEAVLNGKAKLVGRGEWNKDIYALV